MHTKPEISLTFDPIDPAALRKNLSLSRCSGGMCSFEGVVRITNLNKEVKSLFYEAYEPLAMKELQHIAQSTQEKFQLKSIIICHRLGHLKVGDTAVAIMVSATHRESAFTGCKFIIDTLKANVPIWKKETYIDNSYSWVRCTHSLIS